MSVFLGLDIGTSATKVLAMNSTGAIVAEASHSYASKHPKPTWSEQDPSDWWAAVVHGVQEVMGQIGCAAGDVKAIGLSGQMHGAVFLDKNHQVVRPAILWNDQRTTQECDEMEHLCGGRQELVKLVANRAITGFTAPKILWLRRHEPDNFAKTKKILLPKDYVRYRLTGEFATDVSDASGMLLLDVAQRKWSTELLSRLNLDIDLLPTCYESSEITGYLTAEAASLLGLSTKCAVVAGAGDCPAGALGNGVVSPGSLSTLIGTSSVMMVHSDQCKIDPDGRIHTVCHAVPGKWLLMGVNLSGGGCLQWFCDQLCRSDLAHLVDNNSPAGRMFEILAEEAEVIPPGSDGLFFLPYLSGERTPHFDADARGSFIGLTLAHTRGHMVRAIMEGVAYNMADSLHIIRGLGVPVDEIRASGGGSQSSLWRQIQADAFGQDVVRINAEQGPAYGVALLAAVGTGAYTSVEEACTATISVVGRSPYNPDNADYHALRFPAFQQLYHSLKDHFQYVSSLESTRSK